jgi:hypothetical protein
MAKLSTHSEPCSLVFVGGSTCGRRAFRHIGERWFCKFHLEAFRVGTVRDAVGFMATRAGWDSLNLEAV